MRPVEAVLEAYHAAIGRSDDIISARGLADPPAAPEDWWGVGRTVISGPPQRATARARRDRHPCRHLDAVRELLDGRQYLVL